MNPSSSGRIGQYAEQQTGNDRGHEQTGQDRKAASERYWFRVNLAPTGVVHESKARTPLAPQGERTRRCRESADDGQDINVRWKTHVRTPASEASRTYS